MQDQKLDVKINNWSERESERKERNIHVKWWKRTLKNSSVARNHERGCVEVDHEYRFRKTKGILLKWYDPTQCCYTRGSLGITRCSHDTPEAANHQVSVIFLVKVLVYNKMKYKEHRTRGRHYEDSTGYSNPQAVPAHDNYLINCIQVSGATRITTCKPASTIPDPSQPAQLSPYSHLRSLL